MDSQSSDSFQRSGQPAAKHLNAEAITALQPLHDDLLGESRAFDGIVYYSVDKWHPNNASAVVTVQPPEGQTERFAFYRQNIASRRVDLGATALGIALATKETTYIRSKMNPKNHMTWATRQLVGKKVVGGLQAAFNIHYGPLPSEKKIARIWKQHEKAMQEVAHDFNNLSKNITSIGDTLELLAPATPNAFIVSWDLNGSSELATNHYGTLRNYLIDTKNIFTTLTSQKKGDYHDTGDGQDLSIWLPDSVDRADPASIRQFGLTHVLPLIESLREQHAIIALQYPDIQPHIEIALGLGYVEQDKHDGRTSSEYWEVNRVHDRLSDTKQPLGFTEAAQQALFTND